MVRVPAYFVYGEQMAGVSLLVLPGIRSRTLMYFALLGANEEGERIKLRKVKAESAGQTN